MYLIVCMMRASTCFVVIFHIELAQVEVEKRKNGKKYAGGMFDSFNNTNENIDNIKKRKDICS